MVEVAVRVAALVAARVGISVGLAGIVGLTGVPVQAASSRLVSRLRIFRIGMDATF
jgi:hypothetical protein